MSRVCVCMPMYGLYTILAKGCDLCHSLLQGLSRSSALAALDSVPSFVVLAGFFPEGMPLHFTAMMESDGTLLLVKSSHIQG